jgi:hypothetical protein
MYLLDPFPNFSYVHVCVYVVCRHCLLLWGGGGCKFSNTKIKIKVFAETHYKYIYVTLVQMNVGFFYLITKIIARYPLEPCM